MEYSINKYVHHLIKEHVKQGDLCIDATAGKGNDTLYLCQLVGKGGTVIAFDIQDMAVKVTKEKIKSKKLENIGLVYKDCHTNMGKYTEPNSVSCIMFNFGYLPGGNHKIATKADTSIKAIKEGLRLLKKGGLMSLCIYSGGDSGFEEKEGLLEFLKTLNQKEYLVIVNQFYNRSNHPPIPVQIVKYI